MASLEEQVAEIQERLAVIEARLQQLFEHQDIDPRAAAAGETDPTEDPEIQDLLAKGNDAQAIKRYHELTGLSLDEAKQAIERAQAGG